MRISFSCGKCGTVLEAGAETAGLAVTCPHCSASIKVPAARPGPGTTIGGFKIKKLIARGGMGEVYLAEQLSLGRDVALKVLPPHFKSDPETVNRFLAEVRTAAKLQHPNLVTVYEAGQDQGIYFLAMAYIEGETLDDVLSKRGPLPEAQALEIAQELGAALSSAWDAHRLIHCDVKPANIMLDRTGKPHLMDMGLSKLLSETASTAPGEAFGTPNYVSPEQSLNAAHLDFRSDMFSLGMTLYHMLTGVIPFDAPTLAETLHKLDNDTLMDPRGIVTGISPGCVVLLEAMLARQPEDRYPDWASLLKDIARVRKGGKPMRAAVAPGLSVLGRTSTSATTMLRSKLAAKSSRTTALPAKSDVSIGSVVLVIASVVVIIAFVVSKELRDWGAGLLGIQASPATVAVETNAPPVVAPTHMPATAAAEETNAPPATVAPAPDQRLAELEKLFNAAQRYEQEHPQAFKESIRLYKKVLKEGDGTVWGDRAMVVLQRLEGDRKAASDDVWHQLRAEVDPLIADGKMNEAIEKLTSYSGPYNDDTLKRRTEMAEALKKQQAEAEQARMSAQKVNAFVDTLADELLELDFAGIKRELATAGTDAVLVASVECRAITEMARKLMAMPEEVVKSLKRDTGKEITIVTRTGPETGELIGVSGDRLQLKKTLSMDGQAEGFAVVEYRVSDLTVDEWRRRLTGTDVEQELMRGLLSWQLKATEKAQESFQRDKHPLGEALAKRIGGEPKPAAE